MGTQRATRPHARPDAACQEAREPGAVCHTLSGSLEYGWSCAALLRVVQWYSSSEAKSHGVFGMSQGHAVFVEVLHDRFSEAIQGGVRGGTLLAGHPSHAPQPLPTVEL